MITSAYFTGTYLVPGLDSENSSSDVLADLNLLIARYEKEYLQLLFGAVMYREYVTDTDTGTNIVAGSKWDYLLNGTTSGTYLDVNGVTQLWEGMLQTSPTASPIAIYIYCYWLQSKVSSTSITGEKQIVVESANNVNLTAKIVTCWNEMALLNGATFDYLCSVESGGVYVWQDFIEYANSSQVGYRMNAFDELFTLKNSLGF